MPEIVLLGDRFDPLIDTLMLVEQIRRVAPSTSIIIMGALSDGPFIRDLLAVGVRHLFVSDDLTTSCRMRTISVSLYRLPYFCLLI